MPKQNPRWSKRISAIVALACLLHFDRVAPAVLGNESSAKPATEGEVAFFEKKIRPLLATHCFDCHSVRASKLKAGLMLDSRPRILKGGDSGTAMIPFYADKSPLIEAVKYVSNEMPPKGKLPDTDIDNLILWVNMGAPWPEEPEPKETDKKNEFDLDARQKSHWMWQPIVEPEIPPVQNKNWPRQPMDHFILAKLEAAKLNPATPIDRPGLIRRLYFDLLGLPPTAEAVDRFVEDTSNNATETVVDAMLKSPRFGERWGRHWLDLVRYAESRGHEFDADTPNAFQYRDYVIRAFNSDVPYDQLVREHIAGDLLSNPRLNPERGFNESVLGTGFWHLGEWVHSPVDIRKDETDRFDNMIDVMSKTFLAATVSCARCHDHKFDAISARDYYSLSGFLQGSQYRQVRFETLELERSIAAELVKLDAAYASKVKTALIDEWTQHRSEAMIRWQLLEDKSVPKSYPIPTLDSPRENSQIVVDYTSSQPIQVIQDGFIFGLNTPIAPTSLRDMDGTQTPQLSSYTSVCNDTFWHGMEIKRGQPTNLRSPIESMPRPGRTLLTPSFEVTHGIISCLVRGSGHVVACVDSHRLVEGPLHGGTIQEIKPKENELRWVSLNLNRYVGHRVHMEFTPRENQTLEILGVRDGIDSETEVVYRPAASEILGTNVSLEAIIDEAISAWKNALIGSDIKGNDHVAGINWLLRNTNVLFGTENNQVTKTSQVAIEWSEARKVLRSRIPNESAIALAMMDGTGEDDRVLIRGNSAAPGEITPRRFLEAIDGTGPLKIENGSGRLQLAERINDPSNPLTSRVIVNRVWHHLLGRGIVPTVDDFGFLGQRPSHPELLDHLAICFNKNGKSIKGLIRIIVLSQTYQMSSQASGQSLNADPKNLLWQHIAPKRLEGETIRDSLLSISGELNSTMYGNSIPIFLTPFMDGRGRPAASGPLDGDKRRSIYIAVRRNFLSPFMTTFDTPNPFSTMGKRNVSNVPAQSLILMNDPFVIERARHWAEQALNQDVYSHDERIVWMYMTALGRPPTKVESAAAIRFVNVQSRLTDKSSSDVSVWADLAHVLINLKEFVFLR